MFPLSFIVSPYLARSTLHAYGIGIHLKISTEMAARKIGEVNKLCDDSKHLWFFSFGYIQFLSISLANYPFLARGTLHADSICILLTTSTEMARIAEMSRYCRTFSLIVRLFRADLFMFYKWTLHSAAWWVQSLEKVKWEDSGRKMLVFRVLSNVWTCHTA